MTNQPETYLTVPQVAELLNAKPATVRSWLRKKRLQGVRIGRDWRIPASAVSTQNTAAILDRLAERLAALPADRLAKLAEALGEE
jgi:excisionase family DNA binding protein